MTGPDSAYMKRAIMLAQKGVGKTSPNPAVGCVIVNNGTIVGEGWHKKAGEPHAEINALQMAGNLAKNADVYVTLEPCCHTGKTPPCTDALIKAGVSRVFAAMQDPNPQVAGKGLAALNSAGIQSSCGLLEEESRKLNLPFIKQITTGYPFVTYKCAMTLDGNIATVTGESKWISCETSRRLVHRIRASVDAVMVGVDTVLADNPELTVRHVRGKNPLRIIVDSRLRTPESVNVLSNKLASKTIIATTESNPQIHLRYTKTGATVLVCNEYDGRVRLDDMLRKLSQMGIQSIMLEGGSRLAGEMLQHNLIDEMVFFIAPKIIGNNGFAPFTLQGMFSMAEAIRLQYTEIRKSGVDIMVKARPEKSCLPA